jgi:LysM repeat protein
VGGFGVVDIDKARVWAVRLAAPIAFFAAATVLIVLVQRGLSEGNSASPSTTAPATTQPTTETGGTTTGPRRRRFYRVRAGDTLESIAARHDTTVADLLDLNPGIDPLALSPGQRVRIA